MNRSWVGRNSIHAKTFEKCSFLLKTMAGKNFNPPPNFGGLTAPMKNPSEQASTH